MTDIIPNSGETTSSTAADDQLQREIDAALGDQSIEQLMKQADAAKIEAGEEPDPEEIAKTGKSILV